MPILLTNNSFAMFLLIQNPTKINHSSIQQNMNIFLNYKMLLTIIAYYYCVPHTCAYFCSVSRNLPNATIKIQTDALLLGLLLLLYNNT